MEAKQLIKNYLDQRAKTDALFAVSYAKPNKNIDECFNFIIGEASRRGSQVWMSDEEVFGLAVHYYDEDNIVVHKANVSQVRTTVELTEEEKKQAEKEAFDLYKARKLEDMKAKEYERKKAAAERKKEANNQLFSLFES